MSKSIVFMGSGRFAVEVFKKICEDKLIDICAVITQKPKPVGRKKVLTPTFLESYCNEVKIDCLNFETSNEILDYLRTNNFEVDFLVVADYGVILKEDLLSFPKSKSLNVHGSVLPAYRGASPVHSALLNCDHTTGVTIIEMVKELDAGPIYAISEVDVSSEDNYPSLLLKLGEVGGALICKVLKNFESITAIEQDDLRVSFAPKIKKTDGFIDFAEVEAEKVVAMQKAFMEWPGVFFSHNGVKFVLGKIEIVNKPELNLVEAGKFVVDDGLFVKTKSGLLQLIELKPESKNFMLSTNFIRGNPNFF